MDAAGTPTPSMLAEIEYVDAAIGQMVTTLTEANLLNSTTIIITAKHGQSPIDTHRFNPIPGSGTNNTMPPSSVLGPAYLPDSEINQIGATEDDISLLWLKPGADVNAAVSALETAGASAGVGQIFFGSSIATSPMIRPGFLPTIRVRPI